MSIGFAGRGGALVNQLVREFWNKSPGFTIISTGISATVLSLIHGRLAKKVIASFIGDVYPSSGPNPVAQKAYLSGEVEFENWTMLTIPQRLLAGAMGWSGIPPRSIVGSGLGGKTRSHRQRGENRFHRIYTQSLTSCPSSILHGQGSLRSALRSTSRGNAKLRPARIRALL